MRKIFFCICLIFGVLLSHNTVYAAENDIKMLVYLSGDTIDKIELTIDFSDDKASYCMFMIPCKVMENNIIYNSDKFFFDYMAFDNYTLRALAPIENEQTCVIQIANTFGEIYQGITLKGSVTNGEYEMKLIIPTSVDEVNGTKYLCEYSQYSVVQDCPFSSLSYLENGKKILTVESPNSEIILDKTGETSITYEYTMKNMKDDESSQSVSVYTTIFVPLLMTIFSVIFGEGEKEGKLRRRNKILYGIIIISSVPVIICSFLFNLPKWIVIATIASYLVCVIVIIANNFVRIREWLFTIVRKRKEKKKKS